MNAHASPKKCFQFINEPSFRQYNLTVYETGKTCMSVINNKSYFASVFEDRYLIVYLRWYSKGQMIVLKQLAAVHSVLETSRKASRMAPSKKQISHLTLSKHV